MLARERQRLSGWQYAALITLTALLWVENFDSCERSACAQDVSAKAPQQNKVPGASAPEDSGTAAANAIPAALPPAMVPAAELRALDAALEAEADPARAATALALLKAFIAEADLEAADDHAAIAHAMKRLADAKGISLLEQLHAYVSALKPSHQKSPRTAWVLALDSTCERPDDFPSNLRWDDCRGRRCTPRRVRCLEALARAHAFLDGELRDPCGGATQWGARNIKSDVERAARAVAEGRWVPARCAKQTANAFYVQVRR